MAAVATPGHILLYAPGVLLRCRLDATRMILGMHVNFYVTKSPRKCRFPRAFAFQASILTD
ncbi:hypothetical protein CKQ54_19435 [Rahnella variigena]|uniref:Uncharacterized protein n=1 Tax=Rahnella variigena TaxID=574964 RepID=A0ABX9Q233_9GAMM|nr:hypothetical protein D6D38_05515 [Rahnella variigena]RKF70414.1 hypothetical protein CKQ54_19435 [Rahnella variigena]